LRNASQAFTGVNTFNNTVGISAANTLEFGAGVAGQEPNAGKIGYQTFTTGALDIVGAGTSGSNRKIQFWAEGGANFTGGANFGGNVSIGTLSTGSRLEINAPGYQDGVNLWGPNPAYFLTDANHNRQASLGYAGGPAGQYLNDAASGDVVLYVNAPGRLLMANGGLLSGLALNGNQVGIGTATPAARLDVRGDVKMQGGFNGTTVFASGGTEDLRIARGIVRNDGTIYNGAGFTVTTNGVGSYTLHFNPAFSDVPTVTVTPAPNAAAPVTATWNNGNVNSMLIETWSGSAHASVWFQFIAIGGR